MKKYVFAVIFICGLSFTYGQKTYTIESETLELKTEVEGHLSLLWNIIDGQYRYFVKAQDGKIHELKNTKDENNKYQEEYKATLTQLMDAGYNISVADVNLTLPDLKAVIDLYNGTADVSYQSVIKKPKPQLRLGFFGGLTNFPFSDNLNNDISPLFGSELEVISNKENPRHSGFFQAYHAFENEGFGFSKTELSLGYRFRFISTSKVGVYANATFATLSFTKATYVYTDSQAQVVKVSESKTSFDAPFIFGIGADYRISNRGFITFGYHNLVAVFLDSPNHFSTDVSLGFKMIL